MSKATGSHPEAKATAHVVIVEDNVEANNLMRDWLRLRFTVTSFLDAESALRSLPASGDKIVFLIDYNMPGDNGPRPEEEADAPFSEGRNTFSSAEFSTTS